MKSGKFRKLNGTDNKDAEIAEKSGRWMFDPRGTVTREEVVEIFGTEDASWHQFFINPNNFLGDALIFKAKAKEGDREYSIEEYIMLKVSDPTKKIGLLSMLQRAKQDVEKRRAKYAEQTLAAILELAEDVAISAETVGDFARRVAAEKAISKAIEDGHRVTLMRSLPYESNHFTEGALPLAKLNGSKELGAFAGAIRTALAQEEYVAAKEKNDEVLILDKLYATKREDFDLPSVDFGDQNREEMLNKVWFLLQESRSYIESDRLSFTHDMFALLTHLTGFVGTERKDWMFANHAAHVRKVLNRHGILTAGLDAPLNVDRITPEFMLEFLLRGRAGSDAGTVVYTEPTLHCLDKRHIANVNQNCVNVNPGVRGDIDNDSGNWLQHSDPIERVAGILVAKDLETVVAEPERQSALWQALAKQQMIEVDGYGMAIVPESAHVSAGQFAFEGVALTPFEKRELEVLLKQAQTQFSRFYALVNTTARYFGNVVDVSSNTADTHFQAQVKQVKAESVVYQAANGNWTTWEPTAGIRPILEMAVAYTGPEVKEGVEGKSWTTYSADTLGFEIDPAKRYAFRDLAAEILHTYVVDGKTLLEQGLAVGLNTKTSRHHFVVYEKTA
jgi:hypothetical protein